MNNKILEHAIDAVVRSGPRAIGSFVRAWLAVLAVSVVVIAYGCMDGTPGADLLTVIPVAIVCTVLYVSMPAAIVVAVLYIAIRF